ncbi:MAG: type I-E CRISPR-associated protein Cas7/Cse4/CasC [Candidatus Syntrophosphaera sp.]|jgi:CRISPR system Cascade subunit CasC|nr:type I-E CRISPR-associated protein Cas7/Cse4/CasC [Candidatus Cloacimonadota bacterium]MDX9950336.1 type I-E CRISPR-associated protein Cas7/Cse4/CasC [Candidatus Syntrophosphaera sp.]
MLIEMHMIQNHSPANLNRDDLGAPKTCYFGGVLRSRISSQCIKRSIRTSDDFQTLQGGVRTRRLVELIQLEAGDTDCRKRAQEILTYCGFKHEKDNSKMLIFMSRDKVKYLAEIILDESLEIADAAQKVADVITQATCSPDIALFGRMLEPETSKTKWRDTTVEAAMQVAHALSTHAARPEIDYYVAADDVKGEDAGAGFVDEAMFASACFYKYFSIDWDQLVKNLKGNEELAAQTVGAFIKSAALTNPSGKQNSFAAHNPPDGILVEFKDTPVSYANAFVRPVKLTAESDLVELSIGQLANYVKDVSEAYYPGHMEGNAFWFSPNGRHPLLPQDGDIQAEQVGQLEELIKKTVHKCGYEWEAIKQKKVEG